MDPLNVLITGCPRSGTSVLTLLMRGFADLEVVFETEVNPRKIARIRREKGISGPICIKRPVGSSRNPDRDFETPWLKGLVTRAGELKTYVRRGWKVIYCVRDGRDVITSRHRSPDQYFCSAERWTKAMRRALPLLGLPNVHTVRYERLVSDPLRELERIAGFLDLEFDPSWVDNFHRSPKIGSMDFAFRPIDTKSVGGWQQPQHRERIQAEYGQLGTELDHFLGVLGYEPGSTPASSEAETAPASGRVAVP